MNGNYFKTIAVSLVLFCLGGCIKPYERTEETPIELPEKFILSGTDSIQDRWWEEFDDEKLNKLVELSLEGNLTLQIAWSRLDQAAALAKQAGADLYPQLDYFGSASRTVRKNRGSKKIYDTDLSLGLVARYEVDLWGRIKTSEQAAQLDYQAQRYDVDTAAITLVSQVANAWYSLVEERLRLALLDKQIKTNARYVESLELRYRRGQAIAIDLMQQRQQLEATKAVRIRTVARLNVFENQLAVLLGKAPGTFFLPPSDNFPVIGEQPDTGVPLDVVMQRPDVKSAFASLQAADNRVASAIADRFPRINLTARAETTAGRLEDLFDNWLAVILADLAGPIFDGERRIAEVERTKAVVQEQFALYKQSIIQAVQEIEDSLIREKQQKKLLKNQELQLSLLDKVTKQSYFRYANGALDYLRVLDSLGSFQIIEIENLTSQRELVEFRIALYRAMGGGWKLDRPKY